MWGVEKDMTYKQMVQWLSEQGIPTKQGDLNAAAKKDALPIKNTVPNTEKVRKGLSALKGRYPALCESYFLI